MKQIRNERDESTWVQSHFPPGFTGYAAEIGAYDGLSTSNTLQLEEQGWSVLCVEPNPHVHASLKSRRKLVATCACDDLPEGIEGCIRDFHICHPHMGCYSSLRPSGFGPWKPTPTDTWEIVQVPVRTLTSLLDEFHFPRLDFLSVDTEGTEVSVLQGLDFARFAPKCMIIESWPWPSDLLALLEPLGYKLRDRLLVNNLFVRDA